MWTYQLFEKYDELLTLYDCGAGQNLIKSSIVSGRTSTTNFIEIRAADSNPSTGTIMDLNFMPSIINLLNSEKFSYLLIETTSTYHPRNCQTNVI
jgi:hypothetical protein